MVSGTWRESFILDHIVNVIAEQKKIFLKRKYYMLSSPIYNIKNIILDLPYPFTLLTGGNMLLMFHQMPKILWKLFQDNYFMFIYIYNFIFSKRIK